MKVKMLAACLALCAGAVSAATSYVVPWEVNPTLAAKISVVDATGAAVTDVTPVSLDLSADGAWLAASVTSDATGARTVLALPMSGLASLSNGTVTTPSISCAASDLGFAAAPLALATGIDLGATLALDCANGVAKALPNGGTNYTAWVKRQVPKSVTVSGADFASVAALDLAADGETAVSCTGTSGVLTKWTLAGDSAATLTLTQTDTTFDTGLSKVSSVAVYTVGKPNAEKATYAVVGEADASAETKGQVRLVNLSSDETSSSLPTGVTTLIDDSANLGGGIVAVRMSRVDTYRPRLYVLTADGAIRCYCLKEDLTIKMASYVYTNAEFLTAAGAPFADAGASARVTAFAVSADGGTLVLGYAKTADDAEATDAMRLAVLRHTPRTWRFYAADEEGNPSTANEACISDGRWALRWAGWSTANWAGYIHVGPEGSKTSGDAYANACEDEFLDLSIGYVTNVTSATRARIVQNKTYALGTNGVTRLPRVILHSPNLNGFSNCTKNWVGVEELVVDTSERVVSSELNDSAKLRKIGSWTALSTISRAVFNCPDVTNIENFGFDPNGGDRSCAESDATTDFVFPALQTLGQYAIGRSDRFGCLDLPSVVTVSNNAVYNTPNLTEVRLSAEKKTLAQLDDGAFSVWTTPHLARLTLGGVDGFTFGSGALNGQTALEVVTFTGGVPTFADGMTRAFYDQSAKSIRFCVPREHAGWAAALDGHVTELTADERKALWAAAPDKPLPFGVVDETVFLTKYPQYVCWVGDDATARLTVDHDDFFGDEVEVTSDWAPAADGSYLLGTTLTLTPKASEGGTFAKWYGDVPGGAATEGALTLVLTNDVWVYARFVHPWTLSEDKKTASNGNFTVNVSVLDESAKTLTVGKSASFGLYADDDTGEGTLDLGGAVTDTSGAAWTFAAFPGQTLLFTRQPNGKGAVTAFLTPGTLAGEWYVNYGFKSEYSSTKGQPSFRLIVMDEPAASCRVQDWSFTGQTGLSRLILRMPRLTDFASVGAFWLATTGEGALAETDFGWWDVPALATIAPGAFANRWWPMSDSIRAFGVLRLPSFRGVPGPTDSRYVIGNLPNAEGFVLGGLKRGMTVTNVGDNAFAFSPALKTLTIHNAADMTVGKLPFTGGATPAEITFTGRAIKDGGAAFANLFAGVTAAATKPVVVYASEKYGWGSTGYLEALTEDGLAQVPAGERALGVYRGGAAAPLGKALVIDRASPYDPHGAVLIVR